MSWFNDSEEKRWICRIMAITFRIAKTVPPGKLSRSWVAKYLNRSEQFVKMNWRKDPFECAMDSTQKEDAIILSQESQDIIVSTLAKEKKSIRRLQKDIEDKQGKKKKLWCRERFFDFNWCKTFPPDTCPKVIAKECRRSPLVL